MDYIIYTDGAYSSKRDQGGLSFVILDTKGNKIAQFSKAYYKTTNNRMELLAVILSLQSIKAATSITLYTDSMYIVGTVNSNWKRKKNTDLWEQFDSVYLNHPCGNIKIVHVKGHSDNDLNNLCDMLAVKASTK